ncbi:helix-turn-helix transcriptional regulator [Streptomyces microflavus]|uniref:helix-turn-helix transcriptional regulator n=1 Tax=Streptomyces microflavus TaxID=1919 RepID=UPI0034397865
MTATVAEKVRSRLQVRLDLPCPEQRRELRESAGLSQQELADIVGVTRQAVSHWESGIRTPRGPVLNRYIDAIRALRESIRIAPEGP